MHDKEQILSLVRKLKPELQSRYPVKSLALFGSLVRDQQTSTSDVDLLVDLDESATLFDLVGLALFLEEELGCKVDVVLRRALRDEIREAVLNDAVTV
jgi:predicted nucleotidyltransferase